MQTPPYEERFDNEYWRIKSITIIWASFWVMVFLLGLLVIVFFSGCATIELDCPTTGGETIAVGGSTVGNQIVALGILAAQGAMKSGGLAAREGATAAAPPPVMHVHYSYVPIFGSDYVSCQATGGGAPAPIPVAVMSMPANTTTTTH